jgi:hypothetical protein
MRTKYKKSKNEYLKNEDLALRKCVGLTGFGLAKEFKCFWVRCGYYWRFGSTLEGQQVGTILL